MKKLIAVLFVLQTFYVKAAPVASNPLIIKIKRSPSSNKENTILLNGRYKSKQIQALGADEASTTEEAQKIVNTRAENICASLGYKLLGYDDIELIDFETRDPLPHVTIQKVGEFKLNTVQKYYSFGKVYCEAEIGALDKCSFQTHGSEDVFFIQSRRKDNCSVEK
ncbi:MAG: hypothetical protein K2Q18_03080 [Bdellovibrionales bacterium]|nr:hypothetical protein [Bdellovibrionales bacterium]